MSLGSWRTFERIPFEQALAVMQAARDAGITFLDDARYNDDTGTAPLKSGYSEVLFGELFRAAGWPRDETVVANKLWWEFWPDESALRRDRGLARANEARPHRRRVRVSAARGARGRRGRPPDRRGDRGGQGARVGRRQLAGGGDRRGGPRREGAGSPGAVRGTASLQPRLAIVARGPGDDRRRSPRPGPASSRPRASRSVRSAGSTRPMARDGRIAGELQDPRWAEALAAGEALVELGKRLGAPPATLAYAFALAHPSVVSVLFGATTPEQVAENVAAVELLGGMDAADARGAEGDRRRLREVRARSAAPRAARRCARRDPPLPITPSRSCVCSRCAAARSASEMKPVCTITRARDMMFAWIWICH